MDNKRPPYPTPISKHLNRVRWGQHDQSCAVVHRSTYREQLDGATASLERHKKVTEARPSHLEWNPNHQVVGLPCDKGLQEYGPGG